MKEYQKPSVTCNQEVVGFFPALAAVAGPALLGATVGLSKRVTLEREQYPHLEAVMCS